MSKKVHKRDAPLSAVPFFGSRFPYVAKVEPLQQPSYSLMTVNLMTAKIQLQLRLEWKRLDLGNPYAV
ncbi:MAG: hypothetical protein IGS48_10375 [Oscillatoriales cyanobacterium C42_A2020_001]|nr:hypothetical protein [Leptolyngbyaceae cyanobacterium C42_A2020_001]